MALKIKGITLEIGGDTQALSKSLSEANSEINKTQKALKDVDKLLKLDPTNIDLLKQREKLLNNEIDATKKKVDILKDAQRNMDAGGVDKNSDQYMVLQREIIAATQELEKLESAAENANAKLSQIGAIGDKFSSAGKKVTEIGKKMTGVSVGIAGIAVTSAKMSMDFEDAIAKVNTIADTTQVPIDSIKKSIIELSDQSGISAVEIANSVYDAISAGQSTADAVGFVQNATKLAKAGFAETGDALDLLTTIMNSYGLSADEVAKVSDTLIMTQNLGKTTVAELSSAMGKVIPTAKSQGVQLQELASAYAVMTSNGISTAETTTYLNSMLNELGKQGTTAAKAFADGTEHIKEGGLTMAEAMEMGWSLTDVLSILDEQAYVAGTSISNMFSSSEAGKAASVLWDNGAKFNEVFVQMSDSIGATETAYGKLETSSFRMEKSINALKNTAIQLGDSLMATLAPILDIIEEKLRAFTEWFSSLDEEQKQRIVTIGLTVAAIGPLLIVLGTVLKSVGSILGVFKGVGSVISFLSTTVIPALSTALSFLAANPIVLVIAAIVAVIAAIVLFGDQIQEVIAKVDEWLQGVFVKDWTEIFGPTLGEILNGFFATISTVWESIKQILNGVIDFIKGIFSGDWERVWNGVVEIFDGIFQGIVAVAKAPINLVISLINSVINKINGFIRMANKVTSKVGITIGEIGSIPYLAKGGILSRGSAIVGEAGPELLTVAGGKSIVQPLTASVDTSGLKAAFSGIGGATQVNITFEGSLAQLGKVLQPVITIEEARRGPSLIKY